MSQTKLSLSVLNYLIHLQPLLWDDPYFVCNNMYRTPWNLSHFFIVCWRMISVLGSISIFWFWKKEKNKYLPWRAHSSKMQRELWSWRAWDNYKNTYRVREKARSTEHGLGDASLNFNPKHWREAIKSDNTRLVYWVIAPGIGKGAMPGMNISAGIKK